MSEFCAANSVNVKEKQLQSSTLFVTPMFAFYHFVYWRYWPLLRSHQSQTVGFQAIIGTAAEVCSQVNSSGKVKVHFIYQDSSFYQTQQWANWYFGPLKLPFSHMVRTSLFPPVHLQYIDLVEILFNVLCWKVLKREDHALAIQCNTTSVVAQ